jgi:arylsulfatase A-like enzyme
MRHCLRWALGLCLVVTPCLVGAREPAARPNVLFIAVDDLNDWIEPLAGHSQVRTPNFSRLAARGVLFERAYCAAPACNPSRVAVLTGLRPSTSGVYVNDQKFRRAIPDAVTLPQYFSRHGYRVAGGGKIFHHGDTDPRSWPEYFAQPKDPRPKNPIAGPISDSFTWQPVDVPDAEMADYKVVSWAGKWLAENRSEPFFLAVGLYRPHMPLHVPRKYFDAHPLADVKLPVIGNDDLADVPPLGKWFATHRGYHDKIVAEDQYRNAVQAYLAAIEFADAMLGRLLDALDASPHQANTVVVLWSDHGWHLGEKQHWSKFALWERATRVPLIVVAPGITTPGSRSPAAVSLLDLYPTLVELCGLPPAEFTEGTSLAPQLREPNAERADPAVTTFGPHNDAVRDARWRYICYSDGGEELYDHRTDPHEWTNLASNPDHAATLQGLKRLLPKVNAHLKTRSIWLPPMNVP